MARSSDGARVALLGQDNAIRLVDVAANAVALTVQGLRRAAHMAPDARLRAMVLHGGGAAGKLQWWAPLADRQLLALDVAPSNLSAHKLPRHFHSSYHDPGWDRRCDDERARSRVRDHAGNQTEK